AHLERGVHRDPIRPGAEGGLPAVGAEPAKDRQKRFLHRVLGVRVVAGDTERDAVDAVRVLLDDPLERNRLWRVLVGCAHRGGLSGIVPAASRPVNGFGATEPMTSAGEWLSVWASPGFASRVPPALRPLAPALGQTRTISRVSSTTSASRRASSMYATTRVRIDSACWALLLTQATPSTAICQRSSASTSAIATPNWRCTRAITDFTTWRLPLSDWFSGSRSSSSTTPTIMGVPRSSASAEAVGDGLEGVAESIELAGSGLAGEDEFEPVRAHHGLHGAYRVLLPGGRAPVQPEDALDPRQQPDIHELHLVAGVARQRLHARLDRRRVQLRGDVRGGRVARHREARGAAAVGELHQPLPDVRGRVLRPLPAARDQ